MSVSVSVSVSVAALYCLLDVSKGYIVGNFSRHRWFHISALHICSIIVLFDLIVFYSMISFFVVQITEYVLGLNSRRTLPCDLKEILRQRRLLDLKNVLERKGKGKR